MRALILAAGEGTRLRPLTLDRPKPMLPIGGRPLLEHSIDLLRRHGIAEIAINLCYMPRAIVDHFGDGSDFGVAITYSPEERLLGSAGAARRLDWFFDDRFIVLYGDVLTNIDLGALVDKHGRHGALATLALKDVPDPWGCGIARLAADGRIVRFVEKPNGLSMGSLANAGVYALEPEVLDLIPPERPYDFGRDVFPTMIERRLPIYGHRTDDYVIDIGLPGRYEQAEADLRGGLFRQLCLSERRVYS